MFSARYVPGIYINDDRFGGKPYSASDEKVMRVIEMFNKDPQCQAARLKARIYRAHHSSSPQQALLPDIWIDNPDSVFFVEKGEFISPNPAIEHDVASLWQVNRDMYQGIKGSKPLALHDASLSDYNADLPNDLTAIYHLIERVFS